MTKFVEHHIDLCRILWGKHCKWQHVEELKWELHWKVNGARTLRFWKRKRKKVGDLYGAHLTIGWSIYKVNAYLSLFSNNIEISLFHICTSYRLKFSTHFRREWIIYCYYGYLKMVCNVFALDAFSIM